MKAIVIDGTAEEVIQVLSTLQQSTSIQVLDVAEEKRAPSSRSGGNTQYVDKEFAIRVLTRLHLSEGVKAVLKALYDADAEFVSTTDLIEILDYENGHQFAGLMGAFGRRKANTPGNEKEAHFFEYRWKNDTDEWEYRLPDSVREALEQENLV